MRSTLVTLLLVVPPSSARADAGGQLAGVLASSLVEISCRLTSATTTSPSASSSSTAECDGDRDCHADYLCRSGQCVAPPPRPAASLRRQGVELYVRERAVELREELALGRGPVINGLANAERVSARTLGRALREHQAELSVLIGDASGTEWSARFLTRVEELCRPS